MYFAYRSGSDVATVRAVRPDGRNDTALFSVPVPAGRTKAFFFARDNGDVVTVGEPEVNPPRPATIIEYTARGRMLSRFTFGAGSVYPPDLLPREIGAALSPDGRDLAFVATDDGEEYQGVWVLDVRTGRLIGHPLPINGEFVTALAWGPGPGQLTVAGEFDTLHSTLEVLTLKGKLLHSYPARVYDTAGVLALATTPQGILYAGDNDNQANTPSNSIIYQAVSGGRPRVVQSSRGEYVYYLFSGSSLSPDYRKTVLSLVPDGAAVLEAVSQDGSWFSNRWGKIGPLTGTLAPLPTVLGDERPVGVEGLG